MKVFTLTLFAIFGLLSARSLATQGAESFFAEAGLRAGVDAERRINLVSYELFGEIDMDWSWNLSDSLRLNLDIEPPSADYTARVSTPYMAEWLP